ncbi:MAG: hypothetical protein Q4A84_07360 [Neisseria sp.]|uniref:hypothetical protein n=1 Tax=Neisseria sp. TaxID=192066 RepID=UPI0026DB67F4|nr:hypothetical protein [Neisseria sp.]MDO4641501.1 hypothetical protein [Neisseria sp.]
MLLKLVADARDTLLLRFKPAVTYRYSPPAVIGILLLLGLQNAAAYAPLFGRSYAAMAFSLVFVIFKWLLLERVMRMVLHYYGMPKQSLLGFILVSEALLIPAFIAIYFPKLSELAVFWQIWCFWAQAAGLMHLGRANGLKVLLGYICYSIALFLLCLLLLSLFVSAGWLDYAELQARSQQVFQSLQLMRH